MTKKELCDIICSLMGCKECNEMILRQINKYVNEHGWTYKDIARAFAYFVEIEGNTPDPKYGIAIVKFKMEEARKFYGELERQKEQQIKAAQQEIKVKTINVGAIKTKPIKRPQIDISKI